MRIILKSRAVLIAGFSLMLVLLMVLAAISLTKMSSINQHMEEIALKRNIKVDAFQRMRILARDRSLALLNISILEDPFEMDEATQKFSNLAGQWIKTKEMLALHHMNAKENELLDKIYKSGGAVAQQQNAVIELSKNGRQVEARELLIQTLIPLQNNVFKHYEDLFSYQFELTSIEVRKAQQAYQNAFITLGILTLSIVIIGLITSSVVYRSITGSEQRLLKEINRQKSLRSKLFALKTYLSKAQEIAKLGNWSWDIASNDLLWSDEVYRIFYFDTQKKKITLRKFLYAIHPDDRLKHKQIVERALNDTCEPYAIEYRIIRSDGDIRYILEQGECIYESGSNIRKLMGTVQDITERKNFELELARTAQEEEIIGLLLQHSLHFNELNSFLFTVLEVIAGSVDWINHYEKGAIFIIDDKGESNQLVPAACLKFSSCGISNRPQRARNKIRRELTADDLDFIAQSEIDDSFSKHLQTLDAAGLFCTPIIKHNKVLGIFLLYHSVSCKHSNHEYSFLSRIADVVAMGITQHRAHLEIEFYAYHDTLTGLPNRRLLLDRLEMEIHHTSRTKRSGALIFIDLDNFKRLNDSLGHIIGDQLLLQVSHRLKRSVREDDTVARLGGDEFVLIIPHMEGDQEHVATIVRDIAEKLRISLEQKYLLSGHEYHISASFGIAIFSDGQQKADDLLKQSDSALYASKERGRNRISFYQHAMQVLADNRLELERDIRNGLITNQFVLHFQPQIDIDGNITGAEALLRWQHPDKGMISPATFIPVAEDSGLIIPLGIEVLSQACQFLSRMGSHLSSSSFRSLSVNISPKQFNNPDFVESIKEQIALSNIDTSLLTLEITEGVLVENTADVANKMAQLKALSIRFSIDDFGTGYSSMAYLNKLPLDELKIDQSFVSDITHNPSNATIVETIIVMAHHLELSVVAEGVETKEQLDQLISMGCRNYQGYYFERPLSESDFISKLFQRNGVYNHRD